jgi:hypothetical protein
VGGAAGHNQQRKIKRKNNLDMATVEDRQQTFASNGGQEPEEMVED